MDDFEIIAMTDEEIAPLFDHLYRRSIVNLATIEKRPPLLAHYTSLEVLEKIMTTNEIWFSNPLFMNDLQEVRFGMLEGLKAFDEFALTPYFLEACSGSKEKVKMIYTAFHAYFTQFEAEHVLDVYVLCLMSYGAPRHEQTFDGAIFLHSSARTALSRNSGSRSSRSKSNRLKRGRSTAFSTV
jgi:hypothetical protein